MAWAYGLGATALLLYAAWALRRLLRGMNLSLAEAWKQVRAKLG